MTRKDPFFIVSFFACLFCFLTNLIYLVLDQILSPFIFGFNLTAPARRSGSMLQSVLLK